MNPTSTIGQYTAANSIDGAAHYLLIQPGNSSTAYNKINRNVFLGVTGQPMDISTTQTVGGKIFNNTNSLTIQSNNFTIQDNSDTTKQTVFSLSGITTATTRTLTIPNISGTIVTDNSTVTLTNKTITSPSITGGTMDQTTITVDSISGHTSANTMTVAGLTITSGQLGTTALSTNAVQASQLSTSAIKLFGTTLTATATVSSATLAAFSAPVSFTFTMPAGGRDIKVTISGTFSGATTGDGYAIGLYESTTLLSSLSWTQPVGAYAVPVTFITRISAPSAGSHTYLLYGSGAAATTLTLQAGTVNTGQGVGPMTILVEAI